jgi:hypothetical protein
MRADKLADQLSNLEPHTELPEEQWREIEMAIGILEPNKLFRCRIEHCVELAFALAGSDPPSFGEVDGPKRTVVRPELKKLKSDAKRLADRLSRLQAKADLGDKSGDWVFYTSTNLWGALLDRDYPGLWNAVVTEDRFPNVPEEWRGDPHTRIILGAQPLAVSAISHLAAASELAMQSLGKSKGGTTKQNADFDELVCTLAMLYREITGERPTITWDASNEGYSGRFLSFMRACCRAFVPRYFDKTDVAFGKAVQRALEELRDRIKGWTEPYP